MQPAFLHPPIFSQGVQEWTNMSQGIQEWTKEDLWKIAFKKVEVVWST